jgi:Ca2+/Na+ antiporter
LAIFVLAAALCVGASVLLVSRLERVGERLALAEAFLGLVVALATDAPEITSALTAAITGQRTVGVGVALGSNAFNLATMLGVGVVVAGRLRLPRLTTVLEGSLAVFFGLVTYAVIATWISPALGLVLALAIFLPYAVVCALRPTARARLPLPRPWRTWLRRAIEEEEPAAWHPALGGRQDAMLAVAAALVVIGASVAMEETATGMGAQAGVPSIIVGGVVLAAVTSLPNAVAGIYLALRGRGVVAMGARSHDGRGASPGRRLPRADAHRCAICLGRAGT